MFWRNSRVLTEFWDLLDSRGLKKFQGSGGIPGSFRQTLRFETDPRVRDEFQGLEGISSVLK